MCVKWGLEWGSSRFTLFGINFSVDISEIENLNYNPRLKEIENIIKTWTNQILSPIGKITVIKTLIISKLNHLFLSIPSPNSTKLKHFTEKIFSFIWDDKPDKVNRDTLSKPHCLGGLKMINIENYIKGLKLTWIRRINRNNSKLVKLFLFSENLNFLEMQFLGPYKKLNNPFWKEVFDAWQDLQNVQNNSQIKTCPLWKNDGIKIGNHSVLYKDWTKKGVWLINDLLQEDGNFMTFDHFNNVYNIKTNFLTYQGLILSIKKYLKEYQICPNDLKRENGPVLPSVFKVFFLNPRKVQKICIIF